MVTWKGRTPGELFSVRYSMQSYTCINPYNYMYMVLGSPTLNRSPLLNGQLEKSQKILPLITVTSVFYCLNSPLLNGHFVSELRGTIQIYIKYDCW